ncbi:MAG: hypothetical protein ACRDSE_14285 [Pseudonocardiaceae bacterium]
MAGNEPRRSNGHHPAEDVIDHADFLETVDDLAQTDEDPAVSRRPPPPSRSFERQEVNSVDRGDLSPLDALRGGRYGLDIHAPDGGGTVVDLQLPMDKDTVE